MRFFQKFSWRMTVLAGVGLAGLVLLTWGLARLLIGQPEGPVVVRQGPDQQSELVGVLLPVPREIKPFSLIDHEGRGFGLDQLAGKWTFLFFGYTHCPDVCPVAMGWLAEVYALLQATPMALQGVQGVFVSVDPERDTPQQLKEYVPFFHPDFLGVTGGMTEIQAFSKQLGAYFTIPAKGEGAEQGEQTISHTSVFFLVDPQGKFAALFQPQLHPPPRIAELFLKIRQHYGEAL